ncbi:MAG: hypothetical protein J3K34DRAFT_420531, partial [Monoraphidium minutum]
MPPPERICTAPAPHHCPTRPFGSRGITSGARARACTQPASPFGGGASVRSTGFESACRLCFPSEPPPFSPPAFARPCACASARGLGRATAWCGAPWPLPLPLGRPPRAKAAPPMRRFETKRQPGVWRPAGRRPGCAPRLNCELPAPIARGAPRALAQQGPPCASHARPAPRPGARQAGGQSPIPPATNHHAARWPRPAVDARLYNSRRTEL